MSLELANEIVLAEFQQIVNQRHVLFWVVILQPQEHNVNDIL